MEDDAPLAEFHDIGKLIDWVALRLHQKNKRGEPHEFERCVKSEEDRKEWRVELRDSRAWRNIVRKDDFHKLRTETWPESRDWIFTSFADHLAAGYGRAISDERKVKAAPRHGRYCLWTETEEEPRDPRLNDRKALEEMIQFLNNDPTWQEAERKYGEPLRCRAETARPGLNVTTLLSHCRTVGKLARVLARLEWKTRHGRWKDGAEREGAEQHLLSAHYWVEFPHQPYRSKDMIIFNVVERFLYEVEQGEFADNVLSRFDNQVLAVFESCDRMEAFHDAVFQQGLRLRAQIRDRQHTLDEYTNKAKESRPLGDFTGEEEKERWLSPADLPEQFDEPICEVCKMARATKNWLTDRPRPDDDDEEMGKEDLCDSCFEMRLNATGLQKLKEWRVGGLVWVYLSVDVALLRKSLRSLAQKYLRRVLKDDEGKESQDNMSEVVEALDVSLPVVVDFVEDYKAALKEIRVQLEGLDGSKQVERLMDNLLAVRLGNVRPLEVMDVCLRVLGEAFPKLCDPQDSDMLFPIRVAFSASNVKHPFFQHWQFLKNAQSEVSFQLVNSGVARFKMRDSKEIARTIEEAAKRNRSSLHSLAMMASSQPAIAQLALLDKTGRGLNLVEITGLVSSGKLDLASARVLANLASKSRGERSDG